MRTNVAVFDIVFENVLSNTSAYIPPSPLGTLYTPWEILSASHFPIHDFGLKPMLFNFSVAVDEAFLDPGSAALSLSLFSFSSRSVDSRSGVGGGSKVDAEPMDGVEFPPVCWPGCLKMPKLIDFLCGWMLHEIVWSDFTFTQRTR